MQIISSGTVVAGKRLTDMSSCCFPSIAVLSTRRWIAGFRLGPAKGSRSQHAMVAWSDDSGATWSKPIEPLAPRSFEGRIGTWRAVALTPLGGQRVLGTFGWEDHTDPFIPMFDEASEGLVDMKLFTAVSEDGGAHWSEPRLVDCGSHQRQAVPITGPTLVMPDGRWACQFEVNKLYNDPEPWQHFSSLTFSSDEGRTWSGMVDVHTDPARRVFCWDQRLAVMGDGSVLDLFWTFDRQTAKYLNIHARSSRDSGRTWGERWDTGVVGQPSRPVSLPDGRVFMAIVDRTAQTIIRARISSDAGRSWPASTEMEVHRRPIPTQSVAKGTMQDAWTEMSAFSIGLPDATLLPGGDVLVVYYSGPRADQTDIQWARINI